MIDEANGVMGARAPGISVGPRRGAWAALLLSLLAIGSTSALVWDRTLGAGETDEARRAAWIGNEKTRRQALHEMHKDARATIETLQLLATSGPDDTRPHAHALLDHLRKQLGP